MIPVLIGAAGATWLITKLVSGRDTVRANFPLVPLEWWTPRDRLFIVKERAFVALKQGDRLNALYRDYATKHPDHPLGLFYLSMAASNTGDWATARQHAEALVAAEPRLSVGHCWLASCCEKLGDRAAALTAARRFLELEPDSKLVPNMKTRITRLEAELQPALGTPAAKRPKRSPRKKPNASAR